MNLPVSTQALATNRLMFQLGAFQYLAIKKKMAEARDQKKQMGCGSGMNGPNQMFQGALTYLKKSTENDNMASK